MTVRVAFKEAHNAVAVVDERLVLFSRTGPLTGHALDALEQECVAAAQRPGRPIGLLALIPASAGLSSGALLERQRLLVKAIDAQMGGYMCFVVLGQGMMAMAIRTSTRAMFLARPHLHLSDNIPDGVRWIAEGVHMHPLRVEQELALLVHDL